VSQAARASQPAPAEPAAAEPKLGSGEMFDRIAGRYDLVNRILSLGLDQRWRKRLVRSLGLDARSRARGNATWYGERPRILDLATGTGDLAIAMARACEGATVLGVDPSPGMLAVAREKIAERGLAERIELAVGDAQQLPYANCELDAVTIAFGIRNVPDRPAALREMARVVRPGGRIAVLELGEPRRGVMGALARVHTRHIVPWLGALFSGKREYRYLQKSVAAFPPAEEFADMMRSSGLEVVEVVPLTFGVCNLYVATPED
jgi:demethylmenaquinone methyltransferase/2-methoxy-6-polyprenyl-1,4-benzoquinol methylase